jgi:multicomponent K+:H+ antiporter subunit F
MMTTVVDFCLVALAVSMAICLWRVVRGPSLADRVLALDTLSVNLLVVIVLWCIRYRTVAYFDAVLVIAVLGFLGTTALAKYMIKGDIVD